MNYIDHIISEEIHNWVVKIKKWGLNWEKRKNSWLIRKSKTLCKKDPEKQKRILAFQVQLEELCIWEVRGEEYVKSEERPSGCLKDLVLEIIFLNFLVCRLEVPNSLYILSS